MPMILDAESWMNIRRFRALRAAGPTYAEIAAEVGCDWRTVKKYLAADASAVPPRGMPRRGTRPRRIDALAPGRGAATVHTCNGEHGRHPFMPSQQGVVQSYGNTLAQRQHPRRSRTNLSAVN
jgi:hypothetical protein